MRIKILPKRKGFTLPMKKTPEAAAYDVTCYHIEFNPKNNRGVICYLGFATEIPVGFRGVIEPRSGQSNTEWVMGNSVGRIDSDFRGEWEMRFTYIGDLWDGHFFMPLSQIVEDTDFPFKVGNRIGQISFEEVKEPEFEIVDELPVTERGGGSYGSTGVK